MYYLREFNPCHNPSGSPLGPTGPGKFALRNTGICHPTGQSKPADRPDLPYRMHEEDLKRWQRAFGSTGVTPQMLVNAYGTGLAQLKRPASIKWDADENDGHGAFTILLSAEKTIINRQIFLKETGGWAAYHDSLLIPEAAQGSGVGKQMLAETFRVYDQMGLREVTLHANIDIGSYAWARYGFDFDPVGKKVPARALTGFGAGTKARADILVDWNVLTPAQARDLATASVTPGGGIWKVADLKMKLPPSNARTVVDAYLQTIPPGGSNALKDSLTKETVAGLQADADKGVLQVGKLLLMDRHWPGKFTLKNTAQRDRLRAYVGRDVFKD